MLFKYDEYIRDIDRSCSVSVAPAHVAPAHEELFYAKRGICRFCGTNAPKVYDNTDRHKDKVKREVTTRVWQCQGCGWWEISHDGYDNWWPPDLEMLPLEVDRFTILKHGIIKSFDTSRSDRALIHLRMEMHRNPRLIHTISPRQMEQLVQSVFSDYFECEVKHCGRSHDGGVDLFFINADDPIVVQVKRREKRTAVEAVSAVRELLGASHLAGARGCIFVTSADHYSSSAVKTAEKALAKSLVTRFELIDFSSFVDMLNLVVVKHEERWRRYLYHYG